MPTQQEGSSRLVVIQPVRGWACAECGGSGDLLRMDDAGPLCMTCADLDHLAFLPAGDAALTRRATKASVLSAVVVRWSRGRKRYERQGVMVEDHALTVAEQQCLSDADARARRRERDRVRRASGDEEFQARLAEKITRLFPGCPAERATAIAKHTGLRGSGRVGRSAAGRALDENAITLAVAASVRHQDTGYDTLLMSGLPRDAARHQVQPAIDRVLTAWRQPSCRAWPRRVRLRRVASGSYLRVPASADGIARMSICRVAREHLPVLPRVWVRASGRRLQRRGRRLPGRVPGQHRRGGSWRRLESPAGCLRTASQARATGSRRDGRKCWRP